MGSKWKINCSGIWFSVPNWILTIIIYEAPLLCVCSGELGHLYTEPHLFLWLHSQQFPTVWKKAKWMDCHKTNVPSYINSQKSTATTKTSPFSQMKKHCNSDLAHWPEESYQLRQSRRWQLQHNRTCSNTTHPRHIMSAQHLPRGTPLLHYTPLRWGYRLVSIYT